MLRHDYARPQGSPLQAEPDLQLRLRPEPNHRPNEKAQGTKRLPVLFAGSGYSYRKTYYTEKNRIEAQRSGFDSGRRRLKAQMKKWQPPKRLPFLSRAERSPTMVGVRRFELRASWSRTKRATSCATPRYELVVLPDSFYIICTALQKVKKNFYHCLKEKAIPFFAPPVYTVHSYRQKHRAAKEPRKG